MQKGFDTNAGSCLLSRMLLQPKQRGLQDGSLAYGDSLSKGHWREEVAYSSRLPIEYGSTLIVLVWDHQANASQTHNPSDPVMENT